LLCAASVISVLAALGLTHRPCNGRALHSNIPRDIVFAEDVTLNVSQILLTCITGGEGPDPVAEASGTYNYKTKYYFLDGTSLEYLGTDLDESGTVIMTKTDHRYTTAGR
jgi:hypothetical protein